MMIIGAVAVRSNELYVKYRNLKNSITEASTKEEVNNLTWN